MIKTVADWIIEHSFVIGSVAMTMLLLAVLLSFFDPHWFTRHKYRNIIGKTWFDNWRKEEPENIDDYKLNRVIMVLLVVGVLLAVMLLVATHVSDDYSFRDMT